MQGLTNIMKCKFSIAAAALAAIAGSVMADDASAPYQDTVVNARLNVQVDKDTQVVYFIRDNADPDVVTKTYVLKHADPYELRYYLREIVQSRRVDESNTGIQAIKYTDGTGIIMISAEDYRFVDSENGQGIDSIVATLDQPKVVSSTGQAVYLYNPKYRPATELRKMVRVAGANVADDETENIGGSDRIRCDEGLNLMFFDTTLFSKKNITDVLKEYDRPYPEVRAKITVYELYAENDAKLGLDFQAWKNNDGIDLFSVGGRFMQNYAPDGSSLTRGTGWGDTKYLNFNPKWNTKYIDFLTSKGKAKVLHESEITIRNGATAEINRTSQVFLATTEAIEDSSGVEEAYAYATADDGYELAATNKDGNAIEVVGDDSDITVLRINKQGAPEARYFIELHEGSAYLAVNGVNVGRKAEAVTATLSDSTGTPIEFDSSLSVSFMKGNKINTTASNEFGFTMQLTPSITEKATILSVNVANSSLIGYTSTGEARIQQGTYLDSDFMISNEGTKLVIGGIEKRDVVSVSGGLPILKDLPLLGWIFSTESESTKKSQLVVVAEVIPVLPKDELPEGIANDVSKIKGDLGDAGETNTFGYRQFLLDSDR